MALAQNICVGRISTTQAIAGSANADEMSAMANIRVFHLLKYSEMIVRDGPRVVCCPPMNTFHTRWTCTSFCSKTVSDSAYHLHRPQLMLLRSVVVRHSTLFGDIYTFVGHSETNHATSNVVLFDATEYPNMACAPCDSLDAKHISIALNCPVVTFTNTPQ